jgi:glycosyltransferase involved in cell wall biosynthesis
VSVVVCAYTLDRWDDLTKAIDSILTQEPPPHQAILVSDHNAELARRARDAFERRGVKVIENHAERGLSGARNTGVGEASGSIVAFLDDDATAEPEWIARIRAGYRDPSVIGFGGASEPVWHAGRPWWFPDEFDWVVGCTYRGMPVRPSAVRNLIGSNMSFRRDVFDRVGLFSSRVGRLGTTPSGCEETEFCIRATRELPGSQIRYDPAVRVRHHLPANRGTWRYFRDRCFAEGTSKAIVSSLVGARSGLASERAYATRTLPSGVFRAVADAIRMRRPGPLGRAAAIGAGLALTAAGYSYGRVQGAIRRSTKALPAT